MFVFVLIRKILIELVFINWSYFRVGAKVLLIDPLININKMFLVFFPEKILRIPFYCFCFVLTQFETTIKRHF